MSGMSAVLGEAGGCPAVTVGDKTYKIAHPDQLAKKRLEDLIRRRYAAPILALKDTDPELYRPAWDDFLRDLAAGEFITITGKHWLAAMNRQEWPALILTSLLQAHHPRADVDTAYNLLTNAPDQTAAVFAELLPNCLRGWVEDVLQSERFRHAPPAAKAEVKAKMEELLASMLATLSA